jgi:cell shape-determining protein MreC
MGKETMTQRTEELKDEMVLEATDREERYQRQKIIHLEDKIKVLEKSVERLNKLMGDMLEVKE